MAVDALEYDESAEDANPAGALEEILENPERLKDLDLDAFAEELERQVCVHCHRASSIVLSLTIFSPPSRRATVTRELPCMTSVQN